MNAEIREKIEDKVNYFLQAIDSSMPEAKLVEMLNGIYDDLCGVDQNDIEVVRELGLVGVYFTGLDEVKGLEVLTKAFDLSNKMGLIDFPAPFVDDQDKEYNTIVYATMASFLSGQGKKEEAVEYFEKAYKKYEEEKDGMSVACYALDYAGCLIDLNRAEEAKELLHTGIKASYEVFGEYNPIALSLIKGLSMLYKKEGNTEEQEKYEKMFAEMYDYLEAAEDECGCDCGHDHHHHDDCDCGCGHDHHHHDEDCDCGCHEHHHHDDDCDCGCHH